MLGETRLPIVGNGKLTAMLEPLLTAISDLRYSSRKITAKVCKWPITGTYLDLCRMTAVIMSAHAIGVP